MPLDPDNPYNDIAHERTIEKPGTLWGCNNSPRKGAYIAPVRAFTTSVFKWEVVADRSSKTCVHKQFNPDDPKCLGCPK